MCPYKANKTHHFDSFTAELFSYTVVTPNKGQAIFGEIGSNKGNFPYLEFPKLYFSRIKILKLGQKLFRI